MRLLVIEDEKRLAQILAELLRALERMADALERR